MVDLDVHRQISSVFEAAWATTAVYLDHIQPQVVVDTLTVRDWQL